MGCDHTGWGGDIQGGVGTYRVGWGHTGCVWSYRVGAVVQGGVGTTGWGGDVQGGVGTYRVGGDVRSAVIQGGVGTYGVRSYRVGWGCMECGRTGWGGDVQSAFVQGGVWLYEVGCQVVQHSHMCPKVRI